MPVVLNSFERDGFSMVTSESPKRLLVGSQGRERTGKTDWAIRDTPGPIIYIGIDFGHEGVIEKFADKKQIAAFTMNVPPVASQDKYITHWLRLQERIQKAMSHPDVRTVVLDTASDIWELLRLAEFGTLTPRGDIKQMYSQINKTYGSLIKMAYDSEINLICLHKVKKRYVTKTISTNRGVVTQEVWDGNYDRTGFGEGGYLIQCQIEHLFDPDRGKTLEDHFGLRVIDCRQNMGIAGLELWGKENTFCELASYVFDNDPSDWR